MSAYLRRKIEETRTQLQAAEQQIASLRGELRAYEDALAHARQPSEPPETAASVPTLTGFWPSLVLKLAGQQGEFSIDDVARELVVLGKKVGRKSIRSRLVALVRRGTIVRVKDGVFRTPLRGVSPDEMRAAGIIPRHAKVQGVET